MLDAIKNLFGGSKNKSVVGIDIGSSSIKVVQLKRDQGRAVLETYGEIALGPYTDLVVGQATNLKPEVIGAALMDLMREAKVTSTNAGVAIPITSSLINLIEVPTVDPQKLATMVPLEARKYIPVPVSEVLLDWHVIPRRPESNNKEANTGPAKTEVLIVAIHKDTISRYQSILSHTNLNVSFFEIEVFASIRSVLDRGIQPVLVMDLGASNTKLYIVEAGIIRDSHIINQGAQDITNTLSKSMNISFSKAEQEKRKLPTPSPQGGSTAELTTQALSYTLSEARRVVLQYERKYGVSLVDAVLTGGGSLLPGMLQKAGEYLDANIRIADPFSKTETPAVLTDMLKEAGPEFAVAIGIALRKLEEIQ